MADKRCFELFANAINQPSFFLSREAVTHVVMEESVRDRDIFTSMSYIAETIIEVFVMIQIARKIAVVDPDI